MRNERIQSFARTDGETWYEHKGYDIRLEQRGPLIAYQVFNAGVEVLTGIETYGEKAVIKMLSNRLR